jgi:uncharacterized protein YkwD
MRLSLILVVLVAASALASGRPAAGQEIRHEAPPAAPAEIPPDLKEAAGLILEQANQLRRKQNLQPVTRNRELDKAAEQFALVLVRTDQFSHQADGKCPTIRAGEHGYQACFVTENIAVYGCPLRHPPKEVARRFVAVWQESPPHRANMLDPDLIHTGIAVARNDENGHCYAVQMFGRPRDRQIEFQVTNHSRSAVEYQVGEQNFQLPPRYTRTHQHCRTPRLVFPRTDTEAETFQPATGENFLISDAENGSYRIQRQATRQQR